MDPAFVAVLVGTVVVIAVGLVVLRRQGHPEDAATHEHPGMHEQPGEEQGPTGTQYTPGGRPAGPGAESMEPSASPTPDDDQPERT